MEITLVGTKAVTSPAWVSIIGRAVIEPVLPFTAPLVFLSTYSGLTRAALSKKTAVQVENVARISFTSWWSAQKQRDLTICPSLLGQVIINNQGILTAVSEVFTHCCAGVRAMYCIAADSGCRCGNNDGVIHLRRILPIYVLRWR